MLKIKFKISFLLIIFILKLFELLLYLSIFFLQALNPFIRLCTSVTEIWKMWNDQILSMHTNNEWCISQNDVQLLPKSQDKSFNILVPYVETWSA